MSAEQEDAFVNEGVAAYIGLEDKIENGNRNWCLEIDVTYV